MDGWMDGWMMDGWMDVDGWMDSKHDCKILTFLFFILTLLSCSH